MLYKTYKFFIEEVVHNRECILSPSYIFLGASFLRALTKDRYILLYKQLIFSSSYDH